MSSTDETRPMPKVPAGQDGDETQVMPRFVPGHDDGVRTAPVGPDLDETAVMPRHADPSETMVIRAVDEFLDRELDPNAARQLEQYASQLVDSADPVQLDTETMAATSQAWRDRDRLPMPVEHPTVAFRRGVATGIDRDPDLFGGRSFYSALIRTAQAYACDNDRARLEYLAATAHVGGLTEDVQDSIDLERLRLAWATHMLTGPILLRMVSSTMPADRIGNPNVEELLNWRQFVSSPGRRAVLVATIAQSPISALLRTTLVDAIRMMVADRRINQASSLISATSQVARFDAVGGEEIVNLAVSCLLPPGRLPNDINTSEEGR